MAACFSRVAGKALNVFFVSFIVGLIVGVGMILCIVPGIYAAGVYGIAVPAVVLESISASQAVSRSSSLTKGSVGRVIVVYFLTTIFTLCMVVALGLVVDALGSIAFSGTGIFSRQMFQELLSTVGGVLFGPITAIALTLVYYDQRVRKEAFDIEHMMAMMSTPENLASGTSA
jgi:flagellar biosynthesis protein FliR